MWPFDDVTRGRLLLEIDFPSGTSTCEETAVKRGHALGFVSTHEIQKKLRTPSVPYRYCRPKGEGGPGESRKERRLFNRTTDAIRGSQRLDFWQFHLGFASPTDGIHLANKRYGPPGRDSLGIFSTFVSSTSSIYLSLRPPPGPSRTSSTTQRMLGLLHLIPACTVCNGLPLQVHETTGFVYPPHAATHLNVVLVMNKYRDLRWNTLRPAAANHKRWVGT